MQKLPRTETQTLLLAAETSFPHGACNTCECFLGYLAQLRIDSDPADKDLFVPFKVKREDMHKCLGMDSTSAGHQPPSSSATFMLQHSSSHSQEK